MKSAEEWTDNGLLRVWILEIQQDARRSALEAVLKIVDATPCAADCVTDQAPCGVCYIRRDVRSLANQEMPR